MYQLVHIRMIKAKIRTQRTHREFDVFERQALFLQLAALFYVYTFKLGMRLAFEVLTECKD